MNVVIVATKNCSHYPNLIRELNDLGITHEVVFVEDDPAIAAKFGIRHSPNLVVNDEVVCPGQPTEGQLKKLLNL